MDTLKKIKHKFLKECPTYDESIEKQKGFTTKLLYNRSRIGINRLFGTGSHMEAEHTLLNRRLSTGMFRHFRYFGPRAELFVYFLVLVSLKRLINYNLQREKNIESLLNDRNTFFKIELPVKYRKFED